MSAGFDMTYTGLLFNATLYDISCVANPPARICVRGIVGGGDVTASGTFTPNCNSYNDDSGDIWQRTDSQ